jgi:hypothetical protein
MTKAPTLRRTAEAHGVDNIDDGLLKLTNKMRLDVVHREGQVKTRIETKMVPIARALWENNHYQINVALLGVTPEDAMLSTSTSSETQYIEGADQEVVKLCEQYVSYLEALLLDFEREHPAT